jgi:hypothetical protein
MPICRTGNNDFAKLDNTPVTVYKEAKLKSKTPLGCPNESNSSIYKAAHCKCCKKQLNKCAFKMHQIKFLLKILKSLEKKKIFEAS